MALGEDAAGERGEPAIPDDVAVGEEELPPDFFDGPSPPLGSVARTGRTGPGRTGPGRTQAPRSRAAPTRAESGGRGRDARASAPEADHAVTRPSGEGRVTDLHAALLGAGTSAEEVPEAVRDTVSAIEELFPGDLVAATPRPSAGADDDEARDLEGPNDEGLTDEGLTDEGLSDETPEDASERPSEGASAGADERGGAEPTAGSG